MAWNQWVDGAKPTAAQMQDIQDQGITRCTSSTRPQDVYRTDGMVIFETDTRRYYVCVGNGVGASWALLLTTASIPWTPVFTQGSAVAFNNASNYQKSGRNITAFGYGSFTAAGTASNVITCTLPVAAAGAAGVGSFTYFDAGAGSPYLAGSCELTGTNQVSFTLGGTNGARFGTALTIASGDLLQFTVNYEAAS